MLNWHWAHTEDNLAAVRLNGMYGRVFWTGACYNWEVMDESEYENWCRQRDYICLGEGEAPTHNEAREQAELCLKGRVLS